MDLDAEIIKLRQLTKRVEPVIAAFEASHAHGDDDVDHPKVWTQEQWEDLSKFSDRLDKIETQLAPWEQGEEKATPPGVQEIAQRILERIDKIEDKLADVEKFSAELARLSRMTADLAEVVENRVASPGGMGTARMADFDALATGATGAAQGGVPQQAPLGGKVPE